jgi:putative ABC transport system permease protein
MLKSYLAVALRTLRRNTGYSLIHVAGLAVGMAVCMLIFLLVRAEHEYDRFHAKGDRIYRLLTIVPGEGTFFPIHPARLLEPLARHFPEIEKATRVFHRDGYVLTVNEQGTIAGHALFVDPDFLELFDFPLLRTLAARPLAEPMTAVLTQDAALKYFGRADPLGETFLLDRTHVFTVIGVLDEVRQPSHLQFEMLLSAESIRTINAYAVESWNMSWPHIYLLLGPQTPPGHIEEGFPALWKALRGAEAETAVRLQPLRDIHLRSQQTRWDGAIDKADGTLLRGLSLVGLLVLLLACFNYANLATAQAVLRVREVGVRKALGAGRRELIGQFLGEAWLIAAVAAALALLLADVSLPFLRHLSGKQLTARPAPWLFVLPTAIIVGTLAGAYPAFYLSGLQSAITLKGQVIRGGRSAGRGHPGVRRLIVLAQFGVSAALVACTLVIYQQIAYVRHFDIGMDTDHLIVIDNYGTGESAERFRAFRSRVAQEPGVRAVSAAGQLPPARISNYTNAFIEGQTESDAVHLGQVAVYPDLLEVVSAQVVVGRLFDPEREAEFGSTVILNESAVRALNLQEPVGTRLEGINNAEGPQTVIGVIRDVHHSPLHELVDPVVYYVRNWSAFNIVVRVEPARIGETLARLGSGWKAVAPGWPFRYHFLDEQLDGAYRKEHLTERLFQLFTALALFIACLGIFGLAAFSIRQRTREIGIRKILGAGLADIVQLTAREIVILVAAGTILGAPVAWIVTNRWLESFAYRADIGVVPFIATSLVVLVLSLATVGVLAVRAALANPADALRYEC